MSAPEKHSAVASSQNGLVQRHRLTVTGRVQGVGFRPFVYRLALHHNLVGQVQNTSSGVMIDVQGAPHLVTSFRAQLHSQQPPLAEIESVAVETLPADAFREFSIVPSRRDDAASAVVTPDMAMCDDCRREVLDITNPRYRYPFTNCTNCGPRYTIVNSLPYDRERTAMRGFTMCDRCRAEYDDPANRRFHAQPNACPDCGPQVYLLAPDGSVISRRDEAMERAAWALRDGLIVALKGLGGYQLLVDARNEPAVRRLRQRKARLEKPFAAMYPSMAMVRQHCLVSSTEAKCLTSPAAPIVILPVRESASEEPECPAPSVDAGLGSLGVMLPYTPLHLLLLEDLGFPVVATSGNRGGEPICIDDNEALDVLGGIADLFLTHNRPITRPVDDSVVRILDDDMIILRLARGFAPAVLPCETHGLSVFAAGGHMKNAFAFANGGRLILGQHMGELDAPRSRRNYRRGIKELGRLLGVKPSHVVCDPHPDYFSTAHAATLGHPIPVQHHLAHIMTGVAEHGIEGPLLGLAWDGTGFGENETIWGGEALVIDGPSWERVATVQSFPLPGGEQAVRDPRRAAIGLLYSCHEADYRSRMPDHLASVLSSREQDILDGMLKQSVNCPLTSSAGRLFDAVAALLGIFARESTFEGQAAMMLESAAARSQASEPLPVAWSGEQPVRLDLRPMIACLLDELSSGANAADLARRFHATLAESALQLARRVNVPTVVLAGGCFQNVLLMRLCRDRMRDEGISVYWPQRVPLNDGGLAVGQALAAISRMKGKA